MRPLTPEQVRNQAVKICEDIAWSNRNTRFLGPEQNAMKCADEIRVMPLSDPLAYPGLDPHLIDIDNLIEAIRAGLIEIAKNELGGFLDQLLSDATAFVNQSVVSVREWAIQLADGTITQEEFSFLVGGLEDLVVMHALTQAGIAVVMLQRVRKAIIELLISSVLKVLFP